jgi:MerR family transcriptional regulator, thiopeptide resistance regulator
MMTIGQLAARTGTTPRALRLYERRGLLHADRTASGRRIFGHHHVIILAQIRTLKGMGLTLDAIAAVMRAHTLDAGGLIDLRLAQIEAEQTRLHSLAGMLRSAKTAIAVGPIDAARLCELLAEPPPTDFRQLLDRWFTPGEQHAWREAMATRARPGTWDDLQARVRAAVDAGIAPDSEAGAALAAQWQSMMRGMVDLVGVQQWNKGAALVQQAFSGDAGNDPSTAATYAWLTHALRVQQAVSRPTPPPF